MQTIDKIIERRRRKLFGVSNAALINELCAVLDAYDVAGRPRSIEHRLDVLMREIRSREQAGTLVDDDWKQDRLS